MVLAADVLGVAVVVVSLGFDLLKKKRKWEEVMILLTDHHLTPS